MFNIDIKLVIALAPAIICALLVAGIYAPAAVLEALQRLRKDEERLEWWYHVVLHGSFYGSALNAILGVETHSTGGEIITAVWFVVGLTLSRLLSKQLGSLREATEHRNHNKMAGTVRNIVRDEARVALAASLDKPKTED